MMTEKIKLHFSIELDYIQFCFQATLQNTSRKPRERFLRALTKKGH